MQMHTEVSSMPIRRLGCWPPGSPLRNTTVPLAEIRLFKHTQTLGVGDWEQGSPLPRCTGLRNPGWEAAVLARRTVWLDSW